ncbi:MAG: hypothetical protein RL026_1560 [Pseudomonadota bacterium]
MQESATTNRASFTLRAYPVTMLLLGLVALLMLAHIAVTIASFNGNTWMMGFGPKFDMSREANIPSYLSGLLLLLASASAAVLGMGHVGSREQDKIRRSWLICAVGLAFMSLDETTAIHELLNEPAAAALGALGMSGRMGLFYFAWVVPAALGLLAAAPWFYNFLRRMPPDLRRRCLMAGALFVAGAVGIEMFEGDVVEQHGRDWRYLLWVTAEETAEMTAVVLFIRAALLELERRSGFNIRLNLATPPQGA